MLGTRDYARRCGFSRALLGLSGGIDSALVACIAARALGPRNVLGVAMPSRYSSPGSLADAEALARNLGIDFTVIPIEPMFAAYLETLAPALEAFAPPSAPRPRPRPPISPRQNLQARVRGAILMALSNRQGRLLLTTGNKSELATGYCTLYGDMAGGLAVISDVPKTLVYRLARAVNAERAGDPRGDADQAALGRAAPRPDRPGQLPPYDLLDAILEAHLVGGLDVAALVARGLRRRRRRATSSAACAERVQAPPDAARPQDHRQGLRPRPPLSDRARALSRAVQPRYCVAAALYGPRLERRIEAHARCNCCFAR